MSGGHQSVRSRRPRKCSSFASTCGKQKAEVPKTTTIAVEGHQAALWGKQTNSGRGPPAETRFIILRATISVAPRRTHSPRLNKSDLSYKWGYHRAVSHMSCDAKYPNWSPRAQKTQRQKGKAATAAPAVVLVG